MASGITRSLSPQSSHPPCARAAPLQVQDTLRATQARIAELERGNCASEVEALVKDVKLLESRLGRLECAQQEG